MKKYILFGNIVGIGGWQIYIEAKVAYLKENDWEVYVFCPKRTLVHESIKLDGLKEYERSMLVELCYSPYHLTLLQQKQVVDTMVNVITSKTIDDNVIVESTSILDSLWGEILAKRLGAKHIAYLLHSHFEGITASQLEYFSFKYDRRELAGMSNETLPSLFNGYRNIVDNERCELRAVGKNPLSNSPDLDIIANEIMFKVKNCDYVICGFGTLNKPHTIDVLEEVKKFAYKYSDKKVAYIAVGSSCTGMVEIKMQEMSQNCSNLQLVLVEEMYPVSEKMLKKMDVCIGSWGSARVASISGVKTIRLASDKDVKPQGLIGYTLTKEPYSKYECYQGTLVELLEDVLVFKKYNNIEYIPPLPYPNYHEEHKKHMEFIKQSCQSKEYYNMESIRPPNIIQHIKKYVIMVFGIRIADYFFNFFRKK